MPEGLTNGDMAPSLKGTSVDGNEVDLQAMCQEKNVIVIFSRYFGCPVCQAEFDKLFAQKGKILEKASIIYVTQSSETSAKLFLEKKGGVDFPVICDTAPHPLYQAWHIGNVNIGMLIKMAKEAKGYKHGPKEGNEKQSPADFIVDTSGKIIAANYGLLDIDGILEMVELW